MTMPAQLVALERLADVIGSLRNFADVADRCVITEVVNSIPAMRVWADELQEIRTILDGCAGEGEAVAWIDKRDLGDLRILGGGGSVSAIKRDDDDIPLFVNHVVTDDMVDRACDSLVTHDFGPSSVSHNAMRAALTAALQRDRQP